jgi:nitrogen fixation protein NifU and related proteins
MTRDLNELYQNVILDHNRVPRNFRELPAPARRAEGHNPLCGDHLTVWVDLDGETLRDVTFLGNGCAISKASASMMTAAVKGKSRTEAQELAGEFQRLVTGQLPGTEAKKALGKLAALGGVSEFPVRVKCASLPWHTLKAALAGAEQEVSTE